MALLPAAVGLMAGLAFRDVGMRYAQERALAEQMELAAGVELPLVLYEVRRRGCRRKYGGSTIESGGGKDYVLLGQHTASGGRGPAAIYGLS